MTINRGVTVRRAAVLRSAGSSRRKVETRSRARSCAPGARSPTTASPTHSPLMTGPSKAFGRALVAGRVGRCVWPETNQLNMNVLHREFQVRVIFVIQTPYTYAMQHLEPKNIIGYLRVSTEEQARSGLGMDAQRSRIEDEAKRRGWDVQYLSDDGYTASNLNRPALATALFALRNGEADALVVSKLDRLSRSLMDFASLMETARSQRWAVIALDLGVDMSTPSGEMLANVLASFAQYERRLISQRTTDALAALRAKGVVLGRPRVVSPALAARIGQWRAAGCTWQACADALNRAGEPTAHGGVRWYASTVRKVAQSYERQAVAS